MTELLQLFYAMEERTVTRCAFVFHLFGANLEESFERK